MDETDPNPNRTLEELRAVQLDRLRSRVALVTERVPHYADTFAAAGVGVEDLGSLADLARFPFTVKDDLRSTYPLGLATVPRSQIARLHASSGTTGKATVVAYTQGDLDIWADVVARSMRAAGVQPGMTVHVAYGYGLFTGGLGVHYGAERLGCTVIPVSGGRTERQVQLIVDLEPDVILVTPSYMLAILDEMKAQGVDPARTSLKVGIFGAEPWSQAVRQEVEQATGIDAVDIYGLSEIIGPGVSQEFVQTKDGLHIWEDHFYPEVIDPVTGEVLDDGEQGELVLTTLTKTAMPLIRYRTGDLTTLRPGTASPTMRRMDRVVGRSDDMMVLRGVNVFPSQIEAALADVDGLTPHFECVLTRPDRLDQLTVRVERRRGAAAGDTAGALSSVIKDRIGVTVAVEVVDPGAIARSEGKAVRLVDQRPR